MKSSIIFMGSSKFSTRILSSLVKDYPIVGVVTQPDRPAGRGKQITESPVKILACELGLPVIQPTRLREEGVFEQLQRWDASMIVVAAFGQILRQNVLDLPPLGCINVHASYLPRWRGAAPIQAAILHGDTTSGVTIMKMDVGIDTGDILTQRIVPLDEKETAITLEEKLSIQGAELLLATLPDYLEGKITPIHQDEGQATYIQMIKKEAGLMDFQQDALVLERQVRAYQPWPGSFFSWNGQSIKVIECVVKQPGLIERGKTSIVDKYPALGTRDGDLLLTSLQPAGKRSMKGEEFLRGAVRWADGMAVNE
jgi:methionyl-tRNA formyltransferase